MKRQSIVKNLPISEEKSPVVSHRADKRTVRAAGCAAYEVFVKCKKYNPNNFQNYLGCVLNVLYTIIRSGAPREIPVPKGVNRSTISDTQSRFFKVFGERKAFFDRQANEKLRPAQPRIVTQAMSMLPSARSGRGPQKAKALLAQIPAGLKPIHVLLSNGLEFLMARERFLQRKAKR